MDPARPHVPVAPRGDRPLRVLIVRIGAMGDVLHAMPAVAALRERHPDWAIGWAIEPVWRERLHAGGDVHVRAWRVFLGTPRHAAGRPRGVAGALGGWGRALL